MPEVNDASIRILGFKTEYKGKKPIDWVCYAPINDVKGTQVWDAVHRLIPNEELLKGHDETKDMRHAFHQNRWAMIEPAYRAWKEGHELPENGTPLGAWPGISQSQAEAFQRAGIRSVEEVAAMNDAAKRRVHLPGLVGLIKQAGAFLEASQSNEISQRVTELEDQNKALAERYEAAMAMLEEKAKEDTKGKKAKESEAA